MNEFVPYAQIFGPVVTAIAFLAGLWQFWKTQRLTREAKAIDLFLKFNELNDQVSKGQGTNSPEAGFWQHNALVAITEAVFRLTLGDPYWNATVSWMLDIQRPFLTQNPINCASFSPEFVTRMKREIAQLRCA